MTSRPRPHSESDPMRPWRAADLLTATGGTLLQGRPDQVFSTLFIDSRQAAARGLFFAVIGEVHDGHDFVKYALDAGAAGAVIQADRWPEMHQAVFDGRQAVCIGVADTTRALGDAAAFHRKRSTASVVAVTGSSGKTSTRKLMSAVVGQRYETLSTRGNYNNQIGLPLTLLGLTDRHRWAVLELGTNHPGEIRRLSEICTPDIGVIINIAPAHLEGLGSLEGVLAAKAELFENFGADQTAILNADDDMLVSLAPRLPSDVILFGRSKRARIRAVNVRRKDPGIRFDLVLPNETVSVQTGFPGEFMVSNALAAAAVGHRIGLSGKDIRAGIAAFRPSDGRMHLHTRPDGVHIIDDTYNANPASVTSALDTLNALGAGGRTAAVLGDMLELGPGAAALHSQVGAHCAATAVHRLYLTGQYARDTAAGAQEAGLDRQDTVIGSKEDLIRDLARWLKPGDWVLVKGSRGMTMETVVAVLTKTSGTKVD